MGKGEIARYEQFLLFPQCFQKACFPGASKGVIVWEWVKTSSAEGYYRQGLVLYWARFQICITKTLYRHVKKQWNASRYWKRLLEAFTKTIVIQLQSW